MKPPLPRRDFLRLGAAVAGIGALAPHLAAGTAPAVLRRRPPNILLLSTDQWHADAFSHCGTPWVRTPQSDRIAADSTSFACAYAADPVCSPARASWITGRMPSEHRVVGNGFPILESLVDFGQWFGQHGYLTAHLGKWHVPNRDPRHSFAHTCGDHASGQHGDLSIAETARAFLLGRNRDRPFFAHVALHNPHDICQITGMIGAKGRLPVPLEDLPPLPANFAARPTEPPTLHQRVRHSDRRALVHTWDETDWRLYCWMYYRYCELADAALGRVLDALEASGERDHTLLVYTSDHGDGLAHHGMVTKAFMYEESARVPLMLSFPDRLEAGRRDSTQLLSGIDLFPTFCGAAGIPAPAGLSGVDFLAPHAAGQRSRATLVTSASFGGHMMRNDRYKLVRYDADTEMQLFDLRDDPGETSNLAERSEHAGTVAGLLAEQANFEGGLTPFPMPPGGLSEIWRTYRNRI